MTHRPTWQVIEDRDRTDAREEGMRTRRLFAVCLLSVGLMGTLVLWWLR